jgi:hypothetical protein
MFLMLIATFAAGFVAAGTVIAGPRLVGKRAPRHLPPLAAGLAMVAFMIWNEYSWFDRAAGALPEDVKVAATYTQSSIFQPWTMVKPRINRFAAIDLGGARRNPEFPDQVMAEVLLLSRFDDTASRMQVFDCAEHKRADAPQGEGALDWVEVDTDDPLLRTACGS